MKIYLSGSSAELSRAKTWRDRLRATPGVEVIANWIDVIEQVGNANPRDASREDRRGWAATDLRELEAADLVWFLVPAVTAPTRGAWLEAGHAGVHEIPIVFSGDTKQSIFCALGDEHATDELAFEAIRCR